jgi:hypothetical protein
MVGPVVSQMGEINSPLIFASITPGVFTFTITTRINGMAMGTSLSARYHFSEVPKSLEANGIAWN